MLDSPFSSRIFSWRPHPTKQFKPKNEQNNTKINGFIIEERNTFSSFFYFSDLNDQMM